MQLQLRVRAGLVAALTVTTVTLTMAGASAAQASTSASRAAATYTALQDHFAAGNWLFHEQYPVEPTDNPYSYEWPFSQEHEAALDLTAMRRSGSRYDAALVQADSAQMKYWHDAGTTGRPGFASYVEPPYGGGGDFFYDDNEWVGLEDVQHYLFFHDQRSVDQAAKIFALVVSGWDTDSTHADPGGVFWTQASWSQDRNTVSNMPGAELGLRLYQLTGKQSYLRWSLRMYHWTNEHLQRPDGLYWDHLDLAGNIEKTIWSYNQGVPVGVNVLLYQVTGDEQYLQEANRIAAASLRYFGRQDRMDQQPPYFNAIWFKNLLLLQSVTGDPTYRATLADYAQRMWQTHRDPSTGLFHFAGSDPHTQMIEQAAMTQIYAVLAWAPSDYGRLY